jgi:hypothetical protein
VYCTSGISDACYFYNDTAATYANAKASCAAQRGMLVAYNSAREQVGTGTARRSRCKRQQGALHWGGSQCNLASQAPDAALPARSSRWRSTSTVAQAPTS